MNLSINLNNYLYYTKNMGLRLGVYLIIGILILTNVLAYDITLNDKTEGTDVINTNFGLLYKNTVEPINNQISIRLPPIYQLVSSSVTPIEIKHIEEKTFFNLITIFKGTEIIFHSTEPIEIVYKKKLPSEVTTQYFRLFY